MQKLIEVNAAKEFANTFLADPILKMAVNAVLNNCPAAEDVVPVAEYAALKEKNKKLLETAGILDDALREYQQKYGE